MQRGRHVEYREKRYNTMNIEFEDALAIVRFDRPDARNAVNREMSLERMEIFSSLSADESVRVVIVTGDDTAYCAGGDLASFASFGAPEALEWSGRGVAYQKVFSEMPKPTIAAVAGYAYGGGMESVLMCDLRIAADTARFALPEINVGIFPGGGGTQRLAQSLPIARAKELIFLGGSIDAREALELGLVNRVVPAPALLEEARSWAGKLLKKPPLALRAAKMAVNAAYSAGILSGMALEAQAWAALYGTADQKEGMNAFLEKRKPHFLGK